MPSILVAYYSHGGNTRKMAQRISQAATEAGCQVEVRKVTDISVESLAQYDGVILGSPCYFGVMAAEMKSFIDKSIKLFGKGELTGKAGGVFCSTGGIGGGGELTMISLLAGLMIHGMVVQGSRKGGHFGPLAIGEPDERALAECDQYGQLVAGLALRLAR
ncbi:flavodoxin/nitric oxide synthase [Desulfarculus baarsii DSM 2075]|uniref:Flavodoxin/nitric oxide synthase n=1 Tax=Desulfarculus baarsii (strain ATCC 33931 / DSM 2075 / LMG 7858 / VKM B-1802 / 2st14) TaxID=644282 RepID=E1QI30_DESB2|nr:NAD(P)H-dependent oxidoreductase [Desulfarculus baarsii]ADK85223.1 flavodoxin/nitric oxide synthase [Desulfarculus baarsii DSM 2075]